MSYADSLPLQAEQQREELRAIERARRALRQQFVMCEDARKAMREEFYARVRLGNMGKVFPCK